MLGTDALRAGGPAELEPRGAPGLGGVAQAGHIDPEGRIDPQIETRIAVKFLRFVAVVFNERSGTSPAESSV
jgi:hypothetical protein